MHSASSFPLDTSLPPPLIPLPDIPSPVHPQNTRRNNNSLVGNIAENRSKIQNNIYSNKLSKDEKIIARLLEQVDSGLNEEQANRLTDEINAIFGQQKKTQKSENLHPDVEKNEENINNLLIGVNEGISAKDPKELGEKINILLDAQEEMKWQLIPSDEIECKELNRNDREAAKLEGLRSLEEKLNAMKPNGSGINDKAIKYIFSRISDINNKINNDVATYNKEKGGIVERMRRFFKPNDKIVIKELNILSELKFFININKNKLIMLNNKLQELCKPEALTNFNGK